MLNFELSYDMTNSQMWLTVHDFFCYILYKFWLFYQFLISVADSEQTSQIQVFKFQPYSNQVYCASISQLAHICGKLVIIYTLYSTCNNLCTSCSGSFFNQLNHVMYTFSLNIFNCCKHKGKLAHFLLPQLVWVCRNLAFKQLEERIDEEEL